MKIEFLKKLIGFAAILIIAFFLVGVFAGWQATQARFNVDALGRMIQAYQVSEGKTIESLADLPDFEVISSSDGLAAKSADLKKMICFGYSYDLQYLGKGQYVVSASPVGWFNSGYEFGITQKQEMKANRKNPDAQADSYDEVTRWRSIPRYEHVRTKILSEYLR